MKTQNFHCNTKFKASEKIAGKTVKCPKCSQFFAIRPALLLMVVLMALILAGCTSKSDDCVGQWKMDDNINTKTVVDSKGNSDGQAQQNTSILTTTGQIGKAFTFNGSTDYINCGNDSSLDMATNNFSISTWINTSETGQEQLIVEKEKVGVSNIGWRLTLEGIDNGQLKIFLRNGSAYMYSQSINTYNDGNWHHVVATIDRDSNDLNLYVDGAEVYYSAQNFVVGRFSPGISLSTTNNLNIGKRVDDGAQAFHGKIDHVMMFNKTLSTAEISQLYIDGAGIVRYAREQLRDSYGLKGKAHSAVSAVSRDKEIWWIDRHRAIKERVNRGNVDLIFVGDSITHNWEETGRQVWDEYYGSRNAVNMGFAGDWTQHVLWRLGNGEIDGISPKLAVLLIGTNNSNEQDNTAEEIADGIKAICLKMRMELPRTKILILGIFPRGEKPSAQREKNQKASELASEIADGKMVHYLNINNWFLGEDDTLSKDIVPDGVHLNDKGYRIWAEAIESKITELMGR